MLLDDKQIEKVLLALLASVFGIANISFQKTQIILSVIFLSGAIQKTTSTDTLQSLLPFTIRSILLFSNKTDLSKTELNSL